MRLLLFDHAQEVFCQFLTRLSRCDTCRTKTQTRCADWLTLFLASALLGRVLDQHWAVVEPLSSRADWVSYHYYVGLLKISEDKVSQFLCFCFFFKYGDINQCIRLSRGKGQEQVSVCNQKESVYLFLILVFAKLKLELSFSLEKRKRVNISTGTCINHEEKLKWLNCCVLRRIEL